MKADKEMKGLKCEDDPCADTNAKNLWVVGVAVIVLITVFCIAVFRPKTPVEPMPESVPAIAVDGAGQQVAFGQGFCQVALPTAADMACPSFNQCFPQGAAGGQQVALGSQYIAVQCPYCNFAYNDGDAPGTGISRCPKCGATIRLSGQAAPPQAAQANPSKSAPTIFRDAVMPHKFRGVCENCHIVRPDITIPSTAQLPHEYRGVCSNCHKIMGTNAGA